MPDLDHWLPKPSMRVAYRRESDATPDRLWEASRQVRLNDARRLGRLVRWRIPGLAPDLTFDEMFRAPPFIVLDEAEDGGRALVSGLVGRIWTLRRDYPRLTDPEEFRTWSTSGTARVLFANWIEDDGNGHAALGVRGAGGGDRRAGPDRGGGRTPAGQRVREPGRERRDRGRGETRRATVGSPAWRPNTQRTPPSTA